MKEGPIDLLVPELFANSGGVQRYSIALLEALHQIRPNQLLRVFIRNDHPHHLPTSGWHGIEWYPCKGSSTALALALLRAARRQGPELLFSTHPNLAPLQWLHHRITGAPSWCSAHGIDVWTLRPGPKKWALGGLQRLLPVSRFTAERLTIQLGKNCPPLALLPNSFDPARFSPGPRSEHLLKRYALQADQPVIFTLSRLSTNDKYKGINKLIQALPELLLQWPDLKLVIAGDGNNRCNLENLAQKLGMAASVVFTGRISDDEIVDHMRLASTFAMPSSKEGFGIVFLEALGCGLPVLAGNLDGSVDPLADGHYGLLVDPQLPLAPALQSLLAGQGKKLWFQPEALATAVSHQFGKATITRRLEHQLASLEAR